MPVFQGGYDYGTGQLTAGMQGEALAGVPMGGGDDIGGLLGAVLAERRAKAAQARADMIKQQREAANMAGRAHPGSLAEQAAQQAQLNAQTEEARTRAQTAQEARRPAPMRTSFGLGYIAPNQLDTAKMSAAQRQMFLPKEAGLAPGASRMEAGGASSDAASNELFNRRFQGMPSLAQMQANALNSRGF